MKSQVLVLLTALLSVCLSAGQFQCNDKIELEHSIEAYDGLQRPILTDFAISTSFTHTVRRAMNRTDYDLSIENTLCGALVNGAPFAFSCTVTPHFVLSFLKTELDFQLGLSNRVFLISRELPDRAFEYCLPYATRRFVPSPEYLAWQVAINAGSWNGGVIAGVSTAGMVTVRGRGVDLARAHGFLERLGPGVEN